MTASVKSAGIRSIATGFPKTVRDNEWFTEHHPEVFARIKQNALARVFNPHAGTAATKPFDEAMEKYLRDPFSGTVHRRIMLAGESQIDLEHDVAMEALQKAQLAIEDIDMILVSSFPTENVGLGDAAFLAKKLGTKRPAINIETTCSGALACLQIASAMVASGQARNVLIIVSCIYSKTCDWTDTLTWFLGDAVGAYVVGEVPAGEGFLGFHAVNTSEVCGGFEYRIESIDELGPRPFIRANDAAGRAVRDMTPRAIRDCCAGALQAAGVQVGDVDFFITNTPLAWFADLFATTLQIPRAKTISTYAEYANVGPALNPVNLHRALQVGAIRPNDLVVLFTVGSVSTAQACVVRLGELAVGDVVER